METGKRPPLRVRGIIKRKGFLQALPQVAEIHSTQPMDAAGEHLVYGKGQGVSLRERRVWRMEDRRGSGKW
jgi:hypothetical protein